MTLEDVKSMVRDEKFKPIFFRISGNVPAVCVPTSYSPFNDETGEIIGNFGDKYVRFLASDIISVISKDEFDAVNIGKDEFDDNAPEWAKMFVSSGFND